MVKSTISLIVVGMIIALACVWESWFIKSNFNDFYNVVQTTYLKVENQTATQDDVYSLQKNWLEKKKVLHTVIPHSEIKEVDLWVSETVKLVANKQWPDALSKLEVLKELSEQIPRSFSLLPENIL